MADNQAEGSGGMQTIIGPDYNYSKYINSPPEMGMSAKGSFTVLADDISGLLAYVKLLVEGKGKASKTGQPLGNKFFLETPMNCKDKVSKNNVKRSIYINNVPDGTMPFISEGMGRTGFDDFRGLLPGVMSNLAQINPLQILQALTNGPSPTCQAITMQTIDVNNIKSTATAYVTNSDIELMNPSWFVVPGFTKKPDTSEPEDESESFTTMYSNSSLNKPATLKGSSVDYSAMPNDFFIKIYLSSLGLLGLYIFFKMIINRRMK
jgi:hypothetical protein